MCEGVCVDACGVKGGDEADKVCFERGEVLEGDIVGCSSVKQLA